MEKELKAYAIGEMVILHAEARKKGQEIKSATGLVIGTEEFGEIPTTARIVSKGPDVQGLEIGELVLIPDTSRCQNVPDPRIISKEMDAKDPESLILITTHYKNICIVYSDDVEYKAPSRA